jgi:tRNA nucleotidyltransferase/poly(A) polymerase
MMETLSPTFSLTAVEQELFAHLRKLADGKGVTLRIAGGWCRDKLLGRESDDIDVAVDKMTGQQFCKAIGIPANIIAARPEQSKHLETVTTKVCGQKVEFANLRNEDYGDAYEGSRTPSENRIGTPEQDAERRDLTVNALLYNLSTGLIEDYVGGLPDLGFSKDASGKWTRTNPMVCLRTPLPLPKTFEDDPLRVLRTLRFLAKIENSYLDNRLRSALSDKDIHEAFVKKITVERIAGELVGKKGEDGDDEEFKGGILSYEQGPEAIVLLELSGLLEDIFYVPQMATFRPFRSDQNSKWHAHDVFSHSIQLMRDLWKLDDFKALPIRKRSLLQFAALCHDLGKRDPECTQTKDDGTNSYHGHEDSSAVAVRAICNRLKFSTEDIDYVVAIVAGHMRPHSTGWGTAKVLRRFKHDLPDCWEEVLMHALCDCSASGVEREPDEAERYRGHLVRGRELTVTDASAPATNKPIISGKIVMAMIPELAPKTGFIRDVNAVLLEMRLDNPETTEAQYFAKIAEIKPSLLDKYLEKTAIS